MLKWKQSEVAMLKGNVKRHSALKGSIINDPFKNEKILIEELASSGDDVFGFEQIGQSIAETIVENESPFVYGICGGWGSGKSSFLNILIDYLPGIEHNEKKSVIVYFNAWKSSFQNDILFAFVHDIFTQLKKNKALKIIKMNRRLFIRSLKTIIKETAKLLSENFKFVKPLLNTYNSSAGFFNKKMIDTQKKAGMSRASFEEICKILKDITVYVIIDELDRCSPNNVVKIIEAIRMFFFFEDDLESSIKKHNKEIGEQTGRLRIPFKYILSFDEYYVASAFKEYYNLSNLDESFKYISKFVQFKFHIPKKNYEKYVKKLTDDYSLEKKYFPLYSEYDISNLLDALKIEHPREVRRVVVYLIEWQKRLYNDASENKNLRFYGKIEKKFDKKEYKGVYAKDIFLRIFNCYLIIVACIKVKFPVYFDLTLQKNIFYRLPGINTSKLDHCDLYELFEIQKAEINKNRSEINFKKKNSVSVDRGFSNFMTVLWEGLLSLDLNKIDYKESQYLFRDFLHNEEGISNYASELLKTTFSNA